MMERRESRRSSRGATAIELLLTLALIGVLFGLAMARVRPLRDRAAVRSAASELWESLVLARQTAIREGRVVAVRFDGVTGRVTVFASADTFARRRLGVDHGVTLRATRDSIAFGATGLGYGAANATLFITRGAASDTIVISRLGRLRW